uniref:Putative secreted protein n=1 Tax=Anopheles darlingi TaxID=43151 RepID=A0A2M4D3U6_ANODA
MQMVCVWLFVVVVAVVQGFGMVPEEEGEKSMRKSFHSRFTSENESRRRARTAGKGGKVMETLRLVGVGALTDSNEADTVCGDPFSSGTTRAEG